jgi:hypothetical protein
MRRDRPVIRFETEQGECHAKLRVHNLTVSLDGFAAGPNQQRLDASFGDGSQSRNLTSEKERAADWGQVAPRAAVRLRTLVRMSSRRRNCPECRREIAVVAGRFARHDPPGRESGQLMSCPGSRRQAQLGAVQPGLDEYVVPDFPGQLPLF